MKHWEILKLKKSTVSDKKWAVISEHIVKKFSEPDESQVEDDDKVEGAFAACDEEGNDVAMTDDQKYSVD